MHSARLGPLNPALGITAMFTRLSREAVSIVAIFFFGIGAAFSQGVGGGNQDPEEGEIGGITPAAIGFPGGGDPLEFEVSRLEPQIPDRYPGTTAMGDGYNPATGEVTFSAIDISVPGNFAIPFELRRWVPTVDSDTGGPTGWKWDIPHIKGNYLDMKPGHTDPGWDWGYTTWHNGENCTGDSDAVDVDKDDLIYSNMYWNGKLLHIPGVTSEKFLTVSSSGGDEYTKSNFRNDKDNCITNNPSGQEGFVIDGPNGLTYTFNEIKSYWNEKLTLKDPATWTRIILVTKIEDRFGNTVQYSYDADSNLTQILASDGRKIVIAYETVSGVKRPTTATLDNTYPTADRVWTYNYETSGAKRLESVTLPDGSEWEYSGLQIFEFDPDDPPGVYDGQINRYPGNGAPKWAPSCGKSSTTYYASVTTPDGAVIDYTFRETFHDRSEVEPAILWGMLPGIDGQARGFHCTVSLSLIEREVSGPGFDTFTWTYGYSENEGTYTSASQLNGYLTGTPDLSAPSWGFPSMINTTTDVNFRSVTIDGPDKKTVFYIDRKYLSPTEGMVIAQDTVAPNSSTLVERIERAYVKDATRVGYDWYKCPCGGDYPPASSVNYNQIEYRVNQTEQDVIRYSGALSDTYTTEFGGHDTYGFVTETSESNDFSSDERYTLQTYLHDTTNWLLGQPAKTQVADTSSLFTSPGNYDVASEVTYHSATGSYKSLPYEHRSFGRWFRRNDSYHLSGDQKGLPLKISYNATNRWVEFSNYKRGIAQTIKTPQSLSTSPQYAYVTIDDNDWKTQSVDFEGNTTNIGYDSRGRRTLIDPVDTAWANTTISYPVTTGSEGLAFIEAGMPKMVTTRGDFKETVYFDSLWRAILTKKEDTANSLVRYSRTAYDISDNPVFQSYPTETAALATDTEDGIETSYDALNRTTEVDENTSTGSITYSYQDANKIQVNDAESNVTTTTYLAYGSPETQVPTVIAQPESVTTTMAYDIHGNMTSAAQGTITQYNVYDDYNNLCKIVRPDTGNQALLVDAVGQVTWAAWGDSVDGSTSACDMTVDADDKVTNSYDNLGRIKLVDYGDASPDVVTTYDKNGQPLTVSAGAVDTTYVYNSARLLTDETLEVDSETFDVEYGYNSLGHLSSLTYPTSAVIAFEPNAFGEATKAGSYASSIGYHPNGSIETLTYGTEHGTGRIYSTTQNDRQLPEELKIVVNGVDIAKYTHSYDSNNNITFIDDAVNGPTYDRTMTYDGLDRLITADGFWGDGDYSYDVLGNITSKAEGNESMTYNYNTSLNRLSSITGDNARSFTYDERGNVTDDNVHDYTYELSGNMTGVTDLSIDFEYDASKRRVTKADASQTSYTMYSSSGTLLHKKVGGVSTDYIYAGDLLVAEKTGSTVDYMHTDLLGSPIAGSNGTAYKEHYRPWGEKKDHPIQLADDVGYTGHQDDVATGLTYMQARYYDPVVGRFMAVDPVGFSASIPAMFNRFSYVNNNPYGYTDPSGMYGMGTGWSDADWQKFDNGQKAALEQVNNALADLGDLASELSSGGDLSDAGQATMSRISNAVGSNASLEQVNTIIAELQVSATALADDGALGYIANAVPALENGDFGRGEIGGSLITINVGHSAFSSFDELLQGGQRGILHESLHNAGLIDVRSPSNGKKAYRAGPYLWNQRAYDHVRKNTSLAWKSADHVSSVVYP